MKLFVNMVALLLLACSVQVSADVGVAQELIGRYAAIAKMQDANYAGPSATDGKTFFNREVVQFKGSTNKKGKAIACASCHTGNPADVGKHIVTGKKIQPLSPIVNAKRFSDIEEVEKQFNKHCHEVVGSDCSASEKANYIAFLIEDKQSNVDVK